MITITRDRYEEMSFDELAGLIDNIHSYEEMLEIAIYEIQIQDELANDVAQVTLTGYTKR